MLSVKVYPKKEFKSTHLLFAGYPRVEQWGVLEQDPVIDASMTVLEYVQTASEERYQLKRELEQIQSQLTHPTTDLMEKYNDVYNQFLAVDGYQLEAEAEKCLQDVKLDRLTWAYSLDKLLHRNKPLQSNIRNIKHPVRPIKSIQSHSKSTNG